MEPHEHRLGHARRVVDRRRSGGGPEDRLDAAPVLRVEAVARHEHEEREEAPERVAAREQAQPLALAEVEDSHRHLEQLVVRDLEQLVARVCVEDLEERLLVVAAVREAGALEHALHAPAQDRDLGRGRAVGRVRVEPEEHALAHADEVEVRGAVDRGARVGLAERDRRGVPGQPGRGVLLLGVAQDAEARLLGVPVAEEREVVVGEPLEERGRLLVLVAHLVGSLERALAHRLPVLDRAADLADHAYDMALELAQPALVRLACHLGVDHRLARDAVVPRLAGREDLDELPVRVAPHGEDGMDDQVNAAAAPVQLHAHRVDEERHVVGDDLDDRVGGLPAVLLEARVVDADLRRARRPLPHEVERAERQAIQVQRVAVGHVLRGHPPVELPRERLGELGVGAAELLAHTRANGLGQLLLGILDLHPCSVEHTAIPRCIAKARAPGRRRGKWT